MEPVVAEGRARGDSISKVSFPVEIVVQEDVPTCVESEEVVLGDAALKVPDDLPRSDSAGSFTPKRKPTAERNLHELPHLRASQPTSESRKQQKKHRRSLSTGSRTRHSDEILFSTPVPSRRETCDSSDLSLFPKPTALLSSRTSPILADVAPTAASDSFEAFFRDSEKRIQQQLTLEVRNPHLNGP